MKMRMQGSTRTLLSTKAITWLLSLATLTAIVVKGGQWTYTFVGRVNHAVQDIPYREQVQSDSLHFVKLDSTVVKGQQENRQILCYLAKNPPAMVAAGLCKKP